MRSGHVYALIAMLVGSIAGCVGSPVHSTIKYGNVQSKIKANN